MWRHTTNSFTVANEETRAQIGLGPEVLLKLLLTQQSIGWFLWSITKVTEFRWWQMLPYSRIVLELVDSGEALRNGGKDLARSRQSLPEKFPYWLFGYERVTRHSPRLSQRQNEAKKSGKDWATSQPDIIDMANFDWFLRQSIFSPNLCFSCFHCLSHNHSQWSTIYLSALSSPRGFIFSIGNYLTSNRACRADFFVWPRTWRIKNEAVLW